MKKILTKSIIFILSLFLFICDASASINQIGNWSISKEKDPMTDDTNVLIGIESEPYDQSGRTVQMGIRCFDKKTEFLIAARGYFGHPTSKVVMRIDGGKPFSNEWSVAQGGGAIFSPKPITTANQINGHKELLVRLQPYGEANIDAKFNLNGVNDAFDEVKKVCNWK